MDGLRIYVNTQRTETHDGRGVFYSRRNGGPFYRWLFDEKLRK